MMPEIIGELNFGHREMNHAVKNERVIVISKGLKPVWIKCPGNLNFQKWTG